MKQRAYFAGGCFWCIEPVFESADGVLSAVSGYSGGTEANPDYEDVKAQRTGHRETVCVEYDDERISYDRLLSLFLGAVDPFDGEGQFIDRGRSYTLAVYYEREEQRSQAEERLRRLEQTAEKPCFVSVEPFRAFYPAEEEHQDYYRKHPSEFARELEESGRLERANSAGGEKPGP